MKGSGGSIGFFMLSFCQWLTIPLRSATANRPRSSWHGENRPKRWSSCPCLCSRCCSPSPTTRCKSLIRPSRSRSSHPVHVVTPRTRGAFCFAASPCPLPQQTTNSKQKAPLVVSGAAIVARGGREGLFGVGFGAAVFALVGLFAGLHGVVDGDAGQPHR